MHKNTRLILSNQVVEFLELLNLNLTRALFENDIEIDKISTKLTNNKQKKIY